MRRQPGKWSSWEEKRWRVSPNGQPLKRVNIVLTRDKNFKAGDAIIVHSMEELREEPKEISK